jgi:hypothetical protein
MVGEALGDREKVVVVVAIDRGAGKQAHLGHRPELRHGPLDPCRGRGTVDRLAGSQQAAAEGACLLGQDHPCPRAPGGKRRREPGRAAAHHQHVAVGVELVVDVGVRSARRLAQARGLADPVLVAHPERARPHEGLVVEAGRQQAGGELGDAERVVLGTRPAVHALGDEPVVQRDLGDADVGHGGGAGAELDHGVGLLDSGGDDAARPVVLEAAGDEVDAVGE